MAFNALKLGEQLTPIQETKLSRETLRITPERGENTDY